ncbi:MAG: hypothetical protein ACOVOX_13655, partial [Burkholderiaceae bacterium]
RIRYVVEGRQRVEQRLSEIKAQNEQWGARQQEAQDELERIAEQMLGADEQNELLAAQAEEQNNTLPQLEDQLRAAQNKANEQRNQVVVVQQQIQVLASESRSVDEQVKQF